jgi:hypothetical protein
VIKKLASKYEKVRVCYEAGPTGYGLYRQIITLGHECTVVAPSLIPKKAGDRIKTNRRDAVTLARLFRAGELTSVWVPDAVHEGVRDLVRARDTAGADVRKKRQQLPATPVLQRSRAPRAIRIVHSSSQINSGPDMGVILWVHTSNESRSQSSHNRGEILISIFGNCGRAGCVQLRSTQASRRPPTS